jgi:uncharacterized protein YecE (DUF72 family)
MGPIEIGTSGWTYGDWKERFYPARVPQRDWLAYYASRFSTVELNVTAYRLPKERDLEHWRQVPPGFRYTVKLSRLITHRRQPGTPQRFVDNFFRAIAPLSRQIANVLVQLPPFLAREDAVLAVLLDALPPGHRYVVEFRHPSWYAEPVYSELRARGVSLCLHDLAGSVAPLVLTGTVQYVRLHGPMPAYAGSYRRVRLERWASTIVELAGHVDETFVYFNNDERAFATRNAALLRELIDRHLPARQ